jgi:hypothetical protein
VVRKRPGQIRKAARIKTTKDLWFTGQGADIFPEAVSGAVEHGADEDFWFCVVAIPCGHCRAITRPLSLRSGAFNPAHISRAFVWSQVIHEEITPRNTPNTQKFYHPLSLEGPEKHGGEK